jgi:outer membrane protein, heavy metal efflux system
MRTRASRMIRSGGLASSLAVALFVTPALAAEDKAAVRVTLEEAINMALAYNKSLLATRTTIEQSQHQETTASLRPNPGLSLGWSPLPLFKPQQGLGNYLKDSSGLDVGLSYLIERGSKRGERIRAAKDTTSVTRSQVSDNERTLIFQVTSQFINVQLAESTLELVKENLKGFQNAVEIGESKFTAGGISENDYLKIKLQLLQFQTDVEQAQLDRATALSDLRQLLGYQTVADDYDVAGTFDYQPLLLKLDGLIDLAAQSRPDLRAARQSVTAAKSQLSLALSNGVQDLTVSADYLRSPLSGDNTAAVGVSIPLAIFNRNQGEIARTRVAVTQAELQAASVLGQVKTDVRDAYEALQRSERIAQHYRSGYLEVSQKSRDISEYAYKRGASSLFDFLDAERSYRATQIGYRQALAAYLLALEQVRQAVGTRSLP